MRALAVARNVDAGGSRTRPAIALVRDAEKIQASGSAVAGQDGLFLLPTSQAGPAGLNPFELDLDYWTTGFNVSPPQRIAHEMRAREKGYEIPLYRTRADLEAMCARCEEALRAAEVVANTQEAPFAPLPLGPFALPALPAKPPVKEPSKAPLAPDEAAIGFYDWLIDHALIGEWSHEEMSEFYQRHCSDRSLTPTPENVLRAVLKRLPGVNRVQDDHRVKGQGRKRPVVWKIELAPSVKRRMS
jgi:hypothetical protein